MTNDQNERNARINELSEQRAIVEQKVAELDEQIKKLVELAETAGEKSTSDETGKTVPKEALRKHVDKILQKGGLKSLWKQKSELRKVPPFIPIHDRPKDTKGRSTRILSFINFKGGVGKTTIVMNLCGVFAGGYYKTPDGSYGNPLRVLLVDLDFQGTLSDRVVEQDVLSDAFSNKKYINSATLLAQRGKNATLRSITLPVIDLLSARIVPTNDSLDNKDQELYLKFALSLYDSRFYFRHWFHTDDCFQNYDLILFDCPPRITASTVNALAVSDFAYIPAAPETLDARSVQRTQEWLSNLRAEIGLCFRIGGVILNRTNNQNELTPSENKIADRIRDSKAKFDPSDVSGILKTHIPKRNGFRDTFQGQEGTAIPSTTLNSKLSSMNDLASEIYARIYQ